ncbi:MAG: hypothetical protein KA797_09440 [Chitinophagales bacterium]|nr:hypothetical protein [Chitinophagales bacterium]
MNQVHIHLLITHLPIIGSFMGGLVLAHALWTRSDQTKIAAYNLFILSSIGAIIAYVTGEGAEESVENLPGIVESTIKTHEEFALYAYIALIALGLASLVGLFLTAKKSPLTRKTAFIILIISIISFGLVARTGYLGGQIRHTEIANGANLPAEHSEDDDD